MALRLSGRFMISQVMPSCFSIRTVSYFLPVIVVSLRLVRLASIIRLAPARPRRSGAPARRTPPRSSPSAWTISIRAPQARCPGRWSKDRTWRPRRPPLPIQRNGTDPTRGLAISVLELHQAGFSMARGATGAFQPVPSFTNGDSREDANGSSHRQRTIPHGRRRPQHPAVVGVAGERRPDRHQIRLRHRAVRRLHRGCRRGRDALVLRARLHGRGQADHDDRGAGAERRLAQGAEGLARARRAAMRLLPERHDHGGGGAAEGEAEAERCRHRCQHQQHLPLRHLPASAGGDPRRGERVSREAAMTYMPKIDRRTFLVSAAAVGGGLSLGLRLPFGPEAAQAAGGAEVNAWVVVQPDETVIIRIARSEMGQGTLTGLAQLAAEELECDWSKVTYEFPPPGQNVARKRGRGDFFTAGSRGIRESRSEERRV